MHSWPDWTGETAVIVASGGSAVDEPLDAGRGKFRYLAVKDGWRHVPWADALYGCDHHWWNAYRGIPDFHGLKICYNPLTIAEWGSTGRFLKVHIPRGDGVKFLFGKTGEVGWGGHSGFQAINLALQFGARRLLLVGFDMSLNRGRHFFGEHPYKVAPSAKSLLLWRKILEDEAPVLAGRGIEVINCSPSSALTIWRKETFANAYAEIHPEPQLETKAGRHDSVPSRNGKAGHNAVRGGGSAKGAGGSHRGNPPQAGEAGWLKR